MVPDFIPYIFLESRYLFLSVSIDKDCLGIKLYPTYQFRYAHLLISFNSSIVYTVICREAEVICSCHMVFIMVSSYFVLNISSSAGLIKPYDEIKILVVAIV